MSKSLLTRIMDEHDRLCISGKVPDSLFLSKSSIEQLGQEALAALGVKVDSSFLGMSVYPANQYRDGQFRIYCKPEFMGELG